MKQLETLLNDLSITSRATLIGYVDDLATAKDKRWPHFAWKVSIQRDGKTMYSTEYRTGIGHILPMPKNFFPRLTDSVRLEGWLDDPKAPLAPSTADVVSSLLSDAQSAEDTFSGWCSSLGYDTDSRKALDTYIKCQDIGTAMRRLLEGHYQAVGEAAQEH